MPSTSRILERLPSLYRPEPGDRTLFAALIGSIGESLGEISQASSAVLQAHWSAYADSALFSEYVRRYRQISLQESLRPGDAAIRDFEYFCDLPRIAALFDQVPWREPLFAKERVEQFRRRLARLIALYRHGLGTIAALRAMTLISLPLADRAAPPGLQERSFRIEEFAPARILQQAALGRGEPTDLVGPLMRWQLDSQSRREVPALAIIQGLTPVAGAVDATETPLLERFNPADNTGIGIAYEGTLAPDQALALAPTFSSWLGTETGVLRAESVLQGIEAVNSTAPGPWVDEPGAPAGPVVAWQVTPDQSLWAAVHRDALSSLWRYDGQTWVELFADLPPVRCLALDKNTLLIGFAAGIARLELFPLDALAIAPDPATLAGPSVHDLMRDQQGTWWLATSLGAARLSDGDAIEAVGLGERVETQTELFCVFADRDGSLLFGGERGLFQYQLAENRWYYYRGAAASEQEADWILFDPAVESLPTSGEVFLPSVRAVRRGPDAALWLGTDQGCARYLAKESRRTFTTLLEAYPHISQQTVRKIIEDERGQLWFAGDDGLIVFDGLDWFQNQAGGLVRLIREYTALPEAGDAMVFWRFDRTAGRWQSLAAGSRSGFEDFTDPPLASDEPPVRAIAWTDGVVGRLGSFDGSVFIQEVGAVPAPLRMRFKPDAVRVLDGGIRALPRVTPGTSHWRYLALEPDPLPLPLSFPAWTREGRLLPEPSEHAAPWEGRYLGAGGFESFDRVFAYNPAARVWMRWSPSEPLSVTVRLARLRADERLDPAILDRLFLELNRVRPAGVRVMLAEDEEIVRGA